MKRTLLFHRDFHGYSGGHGKVWDYFRHVDAHADWRARIHFSPESTDCGNPWLAAGVTPAPAWEPGASDALFLAGMDWQMHPRDIATKPVINLIQGVRHADLALPLHGFLGRPAIRLCVGGPVAEAISATGMTRGPIAVIESGIEVEAGIPNDDRIVDVFIAAQKQPALGARLAEALTSHGIAVDCVIDWLPRTEFLERMRNARVALTLPLAREGFYLPGLEAMASGCAVVMPDAIGNRAYAIPGHNALMPQSDVEAVTAATLGLLRDKPRLRSMVRAGFDTAAHHNMAQERAGLHRILDNLDALWAQALTATSH